VVLVLVGDEVVDESGHSGLEGVGVLVRAVPGPPPPPGAADQRQGEAEAERTVSGEALAVW